MMAFAADIRMNVLISLLPRRRLRLERGVGWVRGASHNQNLPQLTFYHQASLVDLHRISGLLLHMIDSWFAYLDCRSDVHTYLVLFVGLAFQPW